MAKTIFYSLAALVRKILFCHSKIKFISSRHRVISSMYCAVHLANLEDILGLSVLSIILVKAGLMKRVHPAWLRMTLAAQE